MGSLVVGLKTGHKSTQVTAQSTHTLSFTRVEKATELQNRYSQTSVGEAVIADKIKIDGRISL